MSALPAEHFVNLPILVDQIASSYECIAREHLIGLSVDVAPDLLVSGDARHLRGAVTELIANAFDIAPDGGRVTICGSATDGMAALTISVQNQTVILEKRFRNPERFLTDNASSKLRRLCQRLLESFAAQYGARTRCPDAPCFILRLPLAWHGPNGY